jgi:D-alanyl-D-alanine carboxypeptidase
MRMLRSVAALVAVLAFSLASPAEAGRRKKGGYTPPFASMVVDVKTGRVLQAQNADAPRHPASITKVMTLYLLFEQLERGRYTLRSPLRVSSNAASQAPSKIGFDAGETITVEDAIRALVTKSANDVAVAVAENLAADEGAFAEQMTRRARQLGMTRTTFRNASGLPHPQQITTARDLTILARAVQERFPNYFSYFQTRHFAYNGRAHRNHNRLLGRVEGVDGIKTGYTRASGFNLMTSARLDGRQIVAVVLGGRSGRSRDLIMANLVETHIERAFAGARQTTPIVTASAEEIVRETSAIQAPRPRPETTKEQIESASPRAQSSQPASTPMDLAPFKVASVSNTVPAPVSSDIRAYAPEPVAAPRPVPLASSSVLPPADIPKVSKAPILKDQARLPPVSLASRAETVANPVSAIPAPVERLVPVDRSVTIERPAPVARPTVLPEPTRTGSTLTASRQVAESGWQIQLGATDEETKARALLDRAKSQAGGTLRGASPFTEKVVREGATLYRARFSGFAESGEAQEACRTLKSHGFACFATRS